MAEENNEVNRLRLIFEGLSISVDDLSIQSQDEVAFTQFTAFFNSVDFEKKDEELENTPTHVIILSTLPKRWFDFLAGFSCGSHLPFMVYGQETIAGISGDFASCFSFLRTESSLETFIDAEILVFKKQEAARKTIKARDTLLQRGIPVTGDSLAQCAGEGSAEEVSLFFAAGFSPNTRNKTGVPLLNLAARAGNREVVRFLVMAGAQMNMQADDRGTSALIDGVISNNFNLVSDLIAAGADVNIKSKDGQTALIVAAGASEVKMTEALLKAGADPDITDSLGASARKYAALFHNSSIIELFNTYAPQ
jgi:hypothetical protein